MIIRVIRNGVVWLFLFLRKYINPITDNTIVIKEKIGQIGRILLGEIKYSYSSDQNPYPDKRLNKRPKRLSGTLWKFIISALLKYVKSVGLSSEFPVNTGINQLALKTKRSKRKKSVFFRRIIEKDLLLNIELTNIYIKKKTAKIKP